MTARPDPEAVLSRIPYARFLGVRIVLAGDEMTAVMPYQDRLIGNPVLPALHGGATAAFMELTAMAQLALSEPRALLPRPIDVNVAYLRSGRPKDVFARARLRKAGRRIAHVEVEAWQDARLAPIATLNAHFLLADSN